jgi:hypothetical protein
LKYFRIFPERRKEGSNGRLPHFGGLADGLHSPFIVAVSSAARMGRLPRGRPDDEGVHAGGDGHRSQVVGRVRPGLLQVFGPHEDVDLQEEPENRAVVQQVRGTQGSLANLENQETKKLMCLQC